MKEAEIPTFMKIVSDIIESNDIISDADKRRIITNLWTMAEIEEISDQTQYENYKKMRNEIEARALIGSRFTDFPAFIQSEDGHEFFRSQDRMKWDALDGAIAVWEVGPPPSE